MWGPANLEILKARWAAGDSARVIAGELGCSRNAVIAKANRIHLAPRKVVPNRPLPPQIKSNDLDTYNASIPPWQVRTVLELTDETCRWPITENSPHYFCGAVPAKDSPYCEHHRKVGTVPMPRRSGQPFIIR